MSEGFDEKQRKVGDYLHLAR